MGPDVLELESRRRIYQHVAQHPGKYLRELQRDLDLAMGSLEYHLRELETAGLITCHQDAHKRYFPIEIRRADRPLLALLRQDLPRRALLLVLEAQVASKSQLIETLNVPPSTLNYHLRQLDLHGLLEVGRDGRDAVYRVKDPATVTRLLLTYRATLLDRMVDAFLETTGALR